MLGKFVRFCSVLALVLPSESYTSLRRDEPQVTAISSPHRVLVGGGSVTQKDVDRVMEQRPHLLRHLSHIKPVARLETSVSDEAIEMEEADKMAEDVLKETLAEEHLQPEESATSVSSPSDFHVIQAMAAENQNKAGKDTKASAYHKDMTERLKQMKSSWKAA